MRAESYPQSPGTTRCGERANRAFPHPCFKIFKVLSVAITLLHFRRLIPHTSFFNIPFIMTRILSVAIALLHFRRLISHTFFLYIPFIMAGILFVVITQLNFQRLISHTLFSRIFFPIMTRILSVAITLLHFSDWCLIHHFHELFFQSWRGYVLSQ